MNPKRWQKMANPVSMRLGILLDGVISDLGRQWVLCAWGGLLLAIYFLGWWHGDFTRIALAVLITFFITAPHARGLLILIGVIALFWVYFGKQMGAELHGAKVFVQGALERRAR